MALDPRRDEVIQDIQNILETPGLKALSPGEIAIIIYADVVASEVDREREKWVNLLYVPKRNPQ